jgi:hypothetical protein
MCLLAGYYHPNDERSFFFVVFGRLRRPNTTRPHKMISIKEGGEQMWFNTPMAWILRSPLHGLLSKSTVLITVTGRKSAKKYTLPVNYVRDGDTLWVTSQRERTWWRNLIGGAPLEVVFEGKRLLARGEAFVEEEAVADGLRRYLQKAPQVARYFNVTLDSDGKANPQGLAQAARERVVIRIQIT